MLCLHQLIRNEFNDPFLKSGRLAIVLSSKVSVLLCQVRLVFLASSQVSEPEVLLVLYTGIFKCATAGIRMQSLFYFLSVYWVFFFNFSFL